VQRLSSEKKRETKETARHIPAARRRKKPSTSAKKKKTRCHHHCTWKKILGMNRPLTRVNGEPGQEAKPDKSPINGSANGGA